MKLVCRRIEALPRLAWCARLPKGSDTVTVCHGPWVETRSGGVFEGAWDGPFAEGDFRKALAFSGSGACVEKRRVVFAASADTSESLFSMVVGDELLVSNSIVFLLVESGDSPDVTYPYYRADLLRIYREGLRCRRNTLPTAASNRVALHRCYDLAVTPDLESERLAKPRPRPLVDFETYSQELHSVVGRLMSNAADTARLQPLRPLTMLSRGYDTVAAASIAARFGCREALTVTGEGPDSPEPGDDGSFVAPHMGMEVSTLTRTGYQSLSGLPEAEFCAATTSSGRRAIAAVEPMLQGRLLLTGELGGRMWGLDPRLMLEDLQMPITDIGAHGAQEFRLRVGYAELSVPAVFAVEGPAIHRITLSDEMRPWILGGDYDRPIPRRIAESNGVPRELFGQKKHASLFSYDLSPESEKDYREFLAASGVKLPPVDSWRWRLNMAVGYLGKAPIHLLRRLPPPVFAAVVPRLRIPLRDHRNFIVQTQHHHTFQWGFERIRDRYEWRSG